MPEQRRSAFGQDRRCWKIFVGNLPWQLHWKGVWQVFDRHGVVVDVFVPKRCARDGSRFGFVRLKSKEDAIQIIERLNGFRLYGSVIRIAMAYGNGRSSFWRKKRSSEVVEKQGIESQRPMLMEEVSTKMAQSNQQTEQEGEVEETTQQKENIRVITGFVDDEKLELLSRCALGFCRKPQQIIDLANEFRRADLVGFKIMRVVGSLVLLIFQSLEERKRMLESAVLDTWLENVMEWSPTIAMPNRRVWISACGIPIHAWLVGTFQNLAALWGELVKVGDQTLDPLNFETARFLVETDWFYRIEEIVDLQVEGNVFRVRVMEVDGLLGLTGEEDSGEDRQQDVKDAISPTMCSVDLGLRQSVHALDVSESVVPETPRNTGSPIWHMNRLWEDNMMEDWRVLELPNAESGEAPGSGQVDEVGNAMIMAEVGEPDLEIPIEILGPSERSMELIDVGPRAGEAVTIKLNGEQRRIRQLSEINLSILSPVERCEAKRRLKKKGRGRPRKKPLPEQGIANASLSDYDFIQRQHVILREARETLHLGRLIGVATVGNEEDIVKDITRIIEARGTR
ncbi:hypothetical protein GQ457_17G020660 [Hibiscus cannabinus]